MCTLAVAFYPQTKTPLVITSNRDENPARPATPWDIRRFEDDEYYTELSGMYISNIYCPLDVLGGTWIGTNDRGIFCAITNWDLEENFHGRGLLSRGHIVLNTLIRNNMGCVLQYWDTLEAKNHKPFNIICGNAYEIYNVSCDNKDLVVTQLGAGLHVSTGLGFNQEVPRDTYLRRQLIKYIDDFSQPVNPQVMLSMMASHNCGVGSEDSICVHDKDHRWETRSTTLIIGDGKSWKVKSKDGPACSNTDWTKRIIKIGEEED